MLLIMQNKVSDTLPFSENEICQVSYANTVSDKKV